MDTLLNAMDGIKEKIQNQNQMLNSIYEKLNEFKWTLDFQKRQELNEIIASLEDI